MNNDLTEARRLLDAQTRVHCASTANQVTNVNDTLYTSMVLGADARTTEFSRIPDNYVHFTTIELVFTNIIGATSATWYLSRRLKGQNAFTPPVTTNLIAWSNLGVSGATAVAMIDLPFVRIYELSEAAAVGGPQAGWPNSTRRLYLNLILNNGAALGDSADLTPYLYFKSSTSLPTLTPIVPASVPLIP